MDALLLRGLSFATAALVLVLLARRSARRAFGAGPAFGLWALPALALVLPCLPELHVHWFTLPAIRILPDAVAGSVATAPAPASTPWLRWSWLAGTATMALRLIAHYLRLRRQGRRLPAAMAARLRHELDGFDPRRVRLHPAGPALLWAPRSLLLLPADFLERFDASERRMVLRHELTHLHRGDALWSLVAELAFALLWFHPLAWLARSRFRLDQELACDERVLRDTPHDEARYAHTLLHSAGLSPMPALIPWLAEPQLKERLTMIQHHRPGALRRRAGFIALAALLAGGVVVAQAATDNPPTPDHTATPSLNDVVNANPRYPAAAIKNHEQGTVMLDIQVRSDGSVGTITYDAKGSTTSSADLITAATQDARQWHFLPRVKDGKPVDGYARVPITFSIDDLPSKKIEEPASEHKVIITQGHVQQES
ncbi:TonB family protein [Rhodanobacter sp. DHB23]|uniref:M56 family metallopeptidase n=1 Tax=Rhodanobacter sp. DHB23 TaxID=2775923 RepID=UPI00177FCBB2|nr:TonB family protein [Rhodanobacter sp. DHB23]MBD8872917.1 TonB family protein [Rhodanobacter sp. DHB23]